MENESDVPYVIKGGVAVDDRGVVTFCNGFDMASIRRFYMLENHEAGFVRAWHGHLVEAKYITVLSGVAIVAAVPMNLDGTFDSWAEPSRYVMHANGDVLYVPPTYANGHKNLIAGTRVMHFSTVDLDTSLADNYRFPAESGYHDVWSAEER